MNQTFYVYTHSVPGTRGPVINIVTEDVFKIK